MNYPISPPIFVTTLTRYMVAGTDVPIQCVSQGAGCAVDEAFCSVELPTKYV